MDSSSNRPVPPTAHQAPHRKHIDWATRTVRIELFILLLGCALILALISLWLGFSSNTTTTNSESKNYLDTSKYQAVFLNGNGANTGGSVFFGRITKVTSDYYVLQ